MKKICWIALIGLFFMMSAPNIGYSKEKQKDAFEIPNHVLNISKENTFPNSTEDQEIVQASEKTKELMETLDPAIENPELIKMLNETSVDPSFLAIGYRGMVYLGRWAIHYNSAETTINWEYQSVNTNEINNMGGETNQQLGYVQKEKKEVKGALTNKIANPDDIKKMMLLKAKGKTKLPLSYNTVIGKNTKKENTYAVPVKKMGMLKAYAPAINEKGQVTFADVYIKLKGSDTSLVIKNVTKQGIGAWIPIQDYISFSFNLK